MGVPETRENDIKKKIEEALRKKMEQEAQKKCVEYAAKYSECSGKVIIIPPSWICRKQSKEYNDCILQYSNDSVLEEMMKKYEH